MKNKLAILTLTSGVLLSLSACDVDVKEEGKLPSVDVDVDAEPGKMPEIDVDAAEIEAGLKEVEVEVPKVEMEKEKIKVPVVGVEMPDEDGDEAVEEPVTEEAPAE